MKISSLLIASAIAGTVMAFLSTLPLISWGNCLACMWLWTSGIFGAWLYRYSSQHPITAGQGAVVGILSGLVGAVIGSILGAIFGAIGLNSLFSSQANDPQSALGGAGLSFLLSTEFSLIGLLFKVFLYPFFAAIGGAIGGVIFGKPSTVS